MNETIYSPLVRELSRHIGQNVLKVGANSSTQAILNSHRYDRKSIMFKN